jgi:hypothetical protein
MENTIIAFPSSSKRVNEKSNFGKYKVFFSERQKRANGQPKKRAKVKPAQVIL